MKFNKSTHPNVVRGHAYAQDIVDGKIVSNKYIFAACERYFLDLKAKEENFYFDADAAEKFLKLAQRFQHVEGHWNTPNIVFEPWQCWAFMCIMGFKNKKTGFRRFRTAHLEIARGNGKAHCVKTPVMTPDGPKLWGEVEVGSKLFDRTGGQCVVLAKTPTQFLDAYEITFSDGETTVCSAEHLWPTSSKKERVRKARHGKQAAQQKTLRKEIYEGVRSTKEIAKSLRAYGGKETNHSIDLCKPVQGEKKNLPVEPYLLGYWLGNGDRKRPRLNCHAKDQKQLVSLLKKRKHKIGTLWSKGNKAAVPVMGLVDVLRKADLLENKHIPKEYFSASIQQRLELVRGLLDSDGYISKANGQVEFTNANHKLADGLFILLCSLGYKPTRDTFKVSKKNNFKSDTLFKQVAFTPRGEEFVFNFKRKKSLQVKKRGKHSYTNRRYIVGVKKLKEKVPMFCVEVDSADHCYLIGENMVPTHNSSIASILGLYFLALDNPNGNYISAVATKREQARIVLDSARAMASKNASFLRATGVEVLAHTIVHKKSNSFMRALSADHGGMDGLKDALAICDELHAMSRPVFEVIYSGMSKRKDSLLMCITTAGSDTNSVGFFQTQYAKKVAMGEVSNDSFFSAVYTLDDEDDWADENVWIKANPNLGISVDIDSLRTKVEKALVTPSDIPNIRIKHMNQWISEANAFYDLKMWDACADPKLKLEDFRGKSVRLGLDLASHIDITAIGYVFKEKDVYYIFDKSFLPEDTIKQKKNPFYENCLADGSLIQTKGAAINYEQIQGELLQAAKDHRVIECMYDAWSATETAQKLSDKMEMVKVAMNVSNFSEPMKKLDSLIRSGKIKHNGSTLLRWCMGNVVAKEDHNGNVFPRKSHEKLKIDPVIAILMALAGWINDEGETSVYEERGIRSL